MNLIWLTFILQFNLTSPWLDGLGLYSISTVKTTMEAGQIAASSASLNSTASLASANRSGLQGKAPVAVAHVSRNFYLPRTNSPVYLARLSAGFSTDADGEIIEFSWRVDGSSYRGAEIEIVSFHEPAALTRVQVELTVRDDDGQVSTLNTELVITNISVVSSQSPP
jgi:hypothetical protein